MSEIRQNIDPFTQSAFTFSNRLRRFSWGIVWAFLFRPSPRPCHAWRAWLLRLFGARIGQGCHVYPAVRIWAPWNLIMEDRSSMADDVVCYSMGKICIGERTIISQGVHLCTGTHEYSRKDLQLSARPISIGADAWLCADCFVHPGVTIGAGAVIGARAVVTRDMPAWMVCRGHPCEPVKKREISDSPAGTD